MAFECATGRSWHSCMKVFEYKVLLLACKDTGDSGFITGVLGGTRQKVSQVGPFLQFGSGG
jgi:hypothetical protein